MTIEEVWTKYYAIKSALDAQNLAFAQLELENQKLREALSTAKFLIERGSDLSVGDWMTMKGSMDAALDEVGK